MSRNQSNPAVLPEDVLLSKDPAGLFNLFSLLGYTAERNAYTQRF